MRSTETLFRLGDLALGGLKEHQTALGLTHMPKARFEPILAAAKSASRTFTNARTDKALAFRALRQQRDAVDTYLDAVRSYLGTYLGSEWSEEWRPLFGESLALPTRDAPRCTVLENVSIYFTKHSSRELASEDLTAAHCDDVWSAMRGAIATVVQCKSGTRAKRDARDAAMQALEEALGMLWKELETVLRPTDPLWLKFADRIPGDPRVPEAVENVSAEVQPGRIAVDWPDAPRAARYKLLKQVVGVDAAPVLAAMVEGTDAELTGVSAGQTVRVFVVASNGVGDAPPSQVLELQAA